MSYTPTTWTTGDTITASALNKIENGIANAGGGESGVCIDTEGTLDKSYNDIATMLQNGVLPFCYYEAEGNYGCGSLQSLEVESGTYVANFGSVGLYSASSASAPLVFNE